MNHYRRLFYLPVFLIIAPIYCQSCKRATIAIPNDNNSQETTIYETSHYDNLCDYLFSKDSVNDTLYFNFRDREDFGPVYLSDDELKQIYCEIKRGNIEAYKILCHHYFYSYSQYIPRCEIDKLVCITDYLVQRHSYYRGYLICGNFIFDHLRFCAENVNDFYVAQMITYYEKYFDFSHSKTVAKRLYEIFCGNYDFFEGEAGKALYYEEYISVE